MEKRNFNKDLLFFLFLVLYNGFEIPQPYTGNSWIELIHQPYAVNSWIECK